MSAQLVGAEATARSQTFTDRLIHHLYVTRRIALYLNSIDRFFAEYIRCNILITIYWRSSYYSGNKHLHKFSFEVWAGIFLSYLWHDTEYIPGLPSNATKTPIDISGEMTICALCSFWAETDFNFISWINHIYGDYGYKVFGCAKILPERGMSDKFKMHSHASFKYI